MSKPLPKMNPRERVPTSEPHTVAGEEGISTRETANGSAIDETANKASLSVLQATALLTADCLGVGILALPADVQELGWALGLGFLLINIPVNYYSGTILHITAANVEDPSSSSSANKDGIGFEMVTTNASSLEKNGTPHHEDDEGRTSAVDDETNNTLEMSGESLTHDFIGITSAVFSSRASTVLVTTVYFVNIFLVLGDYILVMSYAVAAMIGDTICLPWAGVIASVLMFSLSQLKTMARLGREASIVSLLCLFIVLVQCLFSVEHGGDPPKTARTSVVGDSVLLRKFSALASIGFAMGSQKLFLNIRHEMKHKEEAPRTLFYSLGTYGTAYILVVVFTGKDPPSFLFEAIPEGFSRCLAGLLLWVHVAVSYSINSQAICSSLDRKLTFWPEKPGAKWIVLTFVLAMTSYTVANGIPFFQDLVSLIGAMTSVPLTLTLPALLYRHGIQQVPLWRYTLGSSSSYSLLVYSMVFLVVGLAGALYSIDRDWANQGKPFACL